MKTLLFYLVLSFTTFICAQTLTVNGKITDSKTNSPVFGAVVYISISHFSYSGNHGFYSIKNLSKGSYTLQVSCIGYNTITRNINLSSNAGNIDFSLEPSPIELDEVIVSTGRTEKFLKNSPYSELVLDKVEIENKSFQSLSDVLKDEAGISLLRDGIWGTEVSIRGLNRENIVTLIDGSRISTSTDIAARLSMIDLNDIERVEVIKGASSSIYGSGATGGIINVVTKSPIINDAFTINGNLSSGFSSVNNLSSIAGSLNSGSSFWSSKISASYRKAGNAQTPKGELLNSQFNDYSFSGSLNIQPIENNLLKLNYQLFKAKDVGIPGASVFPDNADVRYPDEKREMILASYEIQNISNLLYKISAKFTNQTIERNVENIPHTVQNIAATGSTPAKRVSMLKITPGAEHISNSIQLQANLLLASNNNLAIGIDYWDRNYNGHREKYQLIEALNAQGNVISSTNKVIGEKPLPNSKYNSIGIFAQNDYEIIKDKFSVALGARIDKISVSGESTLNPIYETINGVTNFTPAGQKILWNKIEDDDYSYSGNLGIKYGLDSNLDLTLSLGYAFRSPSLEERFQFIDQGSFVRVGNPLLNSEISKSLDLGLRYYGSGFKFISSIFYNYFTDLVAELPGKFEGRNAFIKTNIGKAKLFGFEASADYNFYKDFIIYTNISFVKGEDETSNGYLPDIPPLNANLGLRFSTFQNINLDFSAKVFAEQNNIASGELATPGYAYFNLYCIAPPIYFNSINLHLSAGIENIFNKEYRNHLSTSRGIIRTEPGRNIFIKANVKF